MQLVAALQSADNVTDLSDPPRIARLGSSHLPHKSGSSAPGAFRCVEVVVGDVAGSIFDEVVIRVVTRLDDALSRSR